MLSGPPAHDAARDREPPNKAMKLTRLAAAPGTPTQGAAAWARGLGTGPTASQLMRGVLRTSSGATNPVESRCSGRLRDLQG